MPTTILQRTHERDTLSGERTPAMLRTAFPGHYALERLHPYVFRGTFHLRIAGHYYAHGDGGDHALCGDRYDGALIDLTLHGADAIRVATCKRCLIHGMEIGREAEGEREGVEREYRGMKATLSVLESMRDAQGQ